MSFGLRGGKGREKITATRHKRTKDENSWRTHLAPRSCALTSAKLLPAGAKLLINNYGPPDESGSDDEIPLKPEQIAIPPECREVKAWFWERPGSEIVEEIKRHVAETGLPYTWRGHTHTKPLPGSKPVYREEFDLPEKQLRAKRWAPCPCCTPETPKYGRNGKIAWFPSEGVIRLLGPECFKSLDKEGHEEAKRQLEIERRRKQDTDYLLSKLPLLGRVILVGEQAIPIAKALDIFRDDLHAKLTLDRFPLWDCVRDGGELKIKERSQEFRQNTDGSMRIVDIDVEHVYARLSSYEILNPNLTSCGDQLQAALRKLREHNHGEDWRQKLRLYGRPAKNEDGTNNRQRGHLDQKLSDEADYITRFRGSPDDQHITRMGTT